jgi:DNA-binding IclR family transcriptional regulator
LGTQKSASGKSILRAVDILTRIGQGATSITEISETCNLSKATVHRLLNVLVETHLVQHDQINHQYLLGTLFIQFLSNHQITHEYLIRCADGEMKRLAELTQDTVRLDIISSLNDILVKSIPSKHSLRVVHEIIENEYLHAGSIGKVLLSQLTETDLKIALKNINFIPFTENTIVHADELKVQIKRIREEGYAVSFSERISGALSISTAIANYVVPAALTVLGTQDRMRPRINEILNEMKNSTIIISKNIQECFKIKNMNPG